MKPVEELTDQELSDQMQQYRSNSAERNTALVEEDRRRRKARNRPKNIYFEHREYEGLIFNYVGPLYYMDGTKNKDFVRVVCLNDLGLRAYKTNANTADAKRVLTPYRGPLPDGAVVHTEPAQRRPSSLNERIEKTGIQVRSAHTGESGDLFDEN